MGNLEIEFAEFKKPFEWAKRVSLEGGFVTRFAMLGFALAYLGFLIVFFILIFPVLWIYDQLS